MRLDNMPIMESIQLARMFDEAVRSGDRDSPQSEAFLSRYAEVKNENTNFIYRNAGRSGREQFYVTRPIVNLFTWPRGAMEIVYRNGVQPFWDGMVVGDYSKAWQGASTLGLYIAHMYMAGVLHATIYGQRRYGDSVRPTYDPLFSMFFGAGSPGFGLIQQGLDKLKQLQGASVEQIIGIAKWFAEEGALLVPVLGQMRRVYDAHGDTRGSRNIDALLYELGWGDDMSEDAQRTWAAAVWYSLTGTESLILGSEAASLKAALTLGHYVEE